MRIAETETTAAVIYKKDKSLSSASNVAAADFTIELA